MKYEAAINLIVRFDVDEDQLVNIYGNDWQGVTYLPNELALQLANSIARVVRNNPSALSEVGWSNTVTHVRANGGQGAEANKSRRIPVTTTLMPQTTLSVVQRWNSYTHSIHESRMTEDLERFAFLAKRVPTWDGTKAYVFPEIDESDKEETGRLFSDIAEMIHESYQKMVDDVVRKTFLEYLEGCEEDGIQGAKKPEQTTNTTTAYL